MAKKQKEVNYHQMSVEELTLEAGKAREELFKVRFKMASNASANTMQIRGLRREIARLETFKKQNLDKAPVQKAVAKPAGSKKS